MKELTYYGGQGYDYSEEDGKFKVKYDDIHEKEFSKLSEARMFYESLNVVKAIWDETSMPAELLEAHF